MHINQLVAQSGMDYAEVSGELIMLEMEGKVRAVAGGIYRAV